MAETGNYWTVAGLLLAGSQLGMFGRGWVFGSQVIRGAGILFALYMIASSLRASPYMVPPQELPAAVAEVPAQAAEVAATTAVQTASAVAGFGGWNDSYGGRY